MKLRQFELLLQFADRHAEVVHALFNNAHKFVPQITVGQTEGSAGLLTALIGDLLNRSANPAGGEAPAKPNH